MIALYYQNRPNKAAVERMKSSMFNKSGAFCDGSPLDRLVRTWRLRNLVRCTFEIKGKMFSIWENETQWIKVTLETIVNLEGNSRESVKSQTSRREFKKT